MEHHPETLRILILTARSPHKVLGIPPDATPEQIAQGRMAMRRAVKAARHARGMQYPWSPGTYELLLDTIDRAFRAMPRTPRLRGGQPRVVRF